MMTNETSIVKDCLLRLTECGCIVWRNETAGAWVGSYEGKTPAGHTVISDARMIKVGLCTGSADIIGIAPDGRFLAVEVKKPAGRVTREQKWFLDAVEHAGGVAGVARSGDDAVALVMR